MLSALPKTTSLACHSESALAVRNLHFSGPGESRLSPYNKLTMSTLPAFRPPTAPERAFNRVFGFLVGLGLGFSHNYLLQVKGRKTGRLYSTPIDLLKLDGKRFLVAPRGRTQWVRNAEAAGEIILKKGSARQGFHLRPVPDDEKPAILKAYLDRFKSEVQRFFPVVAGSPAESFRELVESYPAFELIEL